MGLFNEVLPSASLGKARQGDAAKFDQNRRFSLCQCQGLDSKGKNLD